MGKSGRIPETWQSKINVSWRLLGKQWNTKNLWPGSMINLTWKNFAVMFDIHSFLSQNFSTVFQLLKINLQFLKISCSLHGRWDPKWQRILLCVCVVFIMKSAQLCLSYVSFTHYSPKCWAGSAQCVVWNCCWPRYHIQVCQGAVCINWTLLTQ